uniref:mRNA (guanine-N(7))-methyltransferase n=1 Tax=viral metagenome TaxID=1070528 RepID=A0A6C0D8H3_9ZZZZ
MSSSNKQQKESYNASTKKKESPQTQFENLVKLYWGNNPHIKDINKNNELEVRFGTRGIKPLSKIDYDNVIKKLKSLGFNSTLEQGNYMLRIQNEFLDPNTGKFKLSSIRAEINGFHTIQEYCKHNDIKKLMSNGNNVDFQNKGPYTTGSGKDAQRSYPVNFDDFNFRVSYNVENRLRNNTGLTQSIIDNWEKSKKLFRYINRVTFIHPNIPINVDISIVKTSKFVNGKPSLEYTTKDANVFENPEIYEIELEVNNSQIGPGSLVESPETLLFAIRKTIKFILMGLQGTNYPISYLEQFGILQEYMKLIQGDHYNPEKHKRVYPSHFIGPSSTTLQIQNIAPINENAIVPNIRNDYTVTEKADGERNLLFISSKGKIYLLNTNMNVIFTGAETEHKELFNTILDGEIILHDKLGKFINLYAAFDIYFIEKKDVRALGFMPRKKDDLKSKFRLPLLKHIIKLLNPKSVVKEEPISPIRIDSKEFYPITTDEDIFSACKYILTKNKEGLFEYNTDGLIFTPASMGVGGDEIGKVGKLSKSTWDYSFKWKPAYFNTIDFLVTTKKSQNGTDEITPIFQDGIQTDSTVQINEYKTIILRCGFSEHKHGYINPCQDVIDDKLPSFGSADDKTDNYYPLQFYPTNPYDPTAGICKIMLKKDDTGINQMYTEENEVFGDNTIVEFRYEIDNEKGWRWIPLRVRYDKTTELRNGFPNFGNAYHVADSNWHSIHNPITESMICTGINIPDELSDDDVYYNKFAGSSKTRGLRDFHNLYVKNLLITSVSKRNDTLIDYACGKGGDFSKWIAANLSFVFGIDISKDNLENRLNGACARFLNYRKDFKHVPYALFVNGNSGLNIRSGLAMMNDKAVQITKAVFGQGPNDVEKLGKGVVRQYGKGEDGFNISSCQFAIHYLFENQSTFQNFMRNVSECTKLGGYFIGTCYDGKVIFNMLKKKQIGESIELYEGDRKIWEIRKEYDEDKFEDDVSSLGYKIDVFQETINKMFPEYLVNFDYLERVMENYGFKLLTRDESKQMGLPEGSGLFNELYYSMENDIKKTPMKKEKYGSAINMTPNEKKISFLNRYFAFKKISHVNAEKVALESIDETFEEKRESKKEKTDTKIVKKTKTTEKEKTKKTNSKKARPLNKKILLLSTATTDSFSNDIELDTDKKEEPTIIITKKPRAKKILAETKIELTDKKEEQTEQKKEQQPEEEDEKMVETLPPPTQVTIIKETHQETKENSKKPAAKKKMKLKIEE